MAKPLDVFEDNIADAERLLALAGALANTRVRRMRRELRESVGSALGVRRSEVDALDCVESEDVFVVLKPGGRFTRGHFTDSEMRPLLRQAVVAMSAAVETYVADSACARIAAALRDRPPRLKQVSVNLTEVLDIDQQYERRGWGYRKVLETYLRDAASPAPSKIGIVLSVVGAKIDWNAVDHSRSSSSGDSQALLERLYRRRNDIAHQADRQGRGRRVITLAEVREYLDGARSVVEAIDAQLT